MSSINPKKTVQTWNYESLTQKTEATIKRLMSSDKELLRDWAYGVFIAWRDITSGWQADGDIERLESLCITPDRTSKQNEFLKNYLSGSRLLRGEAANPANQVGLEW